MFRNYLITAFRNFSRHKIFSLINVLGLAIGISASLVIFLIVRYGYSFDRFEPGKNRIYRIVSDFREEGNEGHTRGTQGPLVEAVKKEIPGIELTVPFRYYSPGRQMVSRPGEPKPVKFLSQEKIIFADAAYFELLPYHWLAGSAASSMNSAGQVVLSETRAKTYFPSLPYEQMIGSRIIYDDSIIAQVAGVVQDLDKQGNSDFTFQEFISLPTLLDNPGLRKKFFWDEWGSTTSDQQLFVKLGNTVSVAQVNAKLRALADKYKGEDEKKNYYTWTYALQPLSDIHFNEYYGILNGPVASRSTLYGLMLIAGFLLLLACINFINLTTAQATARAKEIGVRKTMGGSRVQLMWQFLYETFVITAAASVLSLLLIPVLLKIFADFIPKELHFSITDPAVLIFFISLTIVVSLLAGIYPSLVLSSWNPIAVLKNQAHARTRQTRRSWMRQTLTVSQLVIAQFFIMSTLLVAKQIRFMLNKELGFRKEAIVSFETPRRDTAVLHRLTLLHEISKLPAVDMTSLGNDVINSGGWWTSRIDYKDGKKELQTSVELKAGDDNYLKLFHIPIIAGRDLLPADTIREVVINETYLHILGFQQPVEAIGKSVLWDNKQVPIVGVMKDFHAHSLQNTINPMAFIHSTNDYNDIVIALNTATKNEWSATIAQMGKLFKEIYPEAEFNCQFLDESIAQSYGREQNIEHLLVWATGLTIFISCLGMLGLVIYSTNQRTKEIGVRKVLGASVPHIVSLLSKDFIALIAIAFVVVTPIVWWVMHNWLEHFAFRTAISWWAFPLCGIGMMLVALVTLSYQTIRAASANPVKSLRTE